MNDEVPERSARLELVPALLEQEQIVANLLQLYAHDFSEFQAIALDADGRFDYPDLPRFWSEPGRYPFLVRVDGQLAGFVLVNKGSRISDSDSVWDIAEFFVMRGYRRHGIGTDIAHEVWRQLPGRWEVRVMQSNSGACRFWESAITKLTSDAQRSIWTAESGERWEVFSFDSQEPGRHDPA